MSGFIPPLSVTISGNKCGGCCRSSSLKTQTPPSNYIIVLGKDSRLIAVPRVSSQEVSDLAMCVFRKIEEHLKDSYGVSIEEIAPLEASFDLTRPPSVRDLRLMETLAKGYVAGVRKGRSSSDADGTPLMGPRRPRTPLPERRDESSSSKDESN